MCSTAKTGCLRGVRLRSTRAHEAAAQEQNKCRSSSLRGKRVTLHSLSSSTDVAFLECDEADILLVKCHVPAVSLILWRNETMAKIRTIRSGGIGTSHITKAFFRDILTYEEYL